jgi:hypothetical protein
MGSLIVADQYTGQYPPPVAVTGNAAFPNVWQRASGRSSSSLRGLCWRFVE